MPASCTAREHVTVSAITNPFVSSCNHILTKHLGLVASLVQGPKNQGSSNIVVEPYL